MNSLPFPSPALRASMRPPCSASTRRTSVSPRPRPPLVRASELSTCVKRSKMFSSISGARPMPVSRTLKTASPWSCVSVSSIRPPGLVYLAAFSSRLEMTCSNRTRIAVDAHGGVGQRERQRVPQRSARGRAASAASRAMATRSMGSRRSSMLPRLMRATSSSSSTSRTRFCVCRSIISMQLRRGHGLVGALQQMDGMHDRRERVPQLMGEHGQELVLAPAGLAQTVHERASLRDVFDGEQDQLFALRVSRNPAGAHGHHALTERRDVVRALAIDHVLASVQHAVEPLAQQRTDPIDGCPPRRIGGPRFRRVGP